MNRHARAVAAVLTFAATLAFTAGVSQANPPSSIGVSPPIWIAGAPTQTLLYGSDATLTLRVTNYSNYPKVTVTLTSLAAYWLNGDGSTYTDSLPCPGLVGATLRPGKTLSCSFTETAFAGPSGFDKVAGLTGTSVNASTGAPVDVGLGNTTVHAWGLVVSNIKSAVTGAGTVTVTNPSGNWAPVSILSAALTSSAGTALACPGLAGTSISVGVTKTCVYTDAPAATDTFTMTDQDSASTAGVQSISVAS